jgi:hypothetical protein
LYWTDISLTLGYVVVLPNPKKPADVVPGRSGVAADGLFATQVDVVPFQY